MVKPKAISDVLVRVQAIIVRSSARRLRSAANRVFASRGRSAMATSQSVLHGLRTTSRSQRTRGYYPCYGSPDSLPKPSAPDRGGLVPGLRQQPTPPQLRRIDVALPIRVSTATEN